jgi:DNA gyrase subunit A
MVIDEKHDLFVISADGIAKASPIEEYPLQGRAGSGVITMKLPNDSPGLSAAAAGDSSEQLIVLTSKNRGKVLRMSAAPKARRAGKGDYVISLSGKEQVAAVVLYQPSVEIPVVLDEAGEAVPTEG